MKIRAARLADALPIAHVLVDTFMESNRGLMSETAWQRRQQEWTYEVSARAWEKVMVGIEQGVSPAECLLVAEGETGEVVGMAYTCPAKDASDPQDVGEIDVLYVRESHQRRGIGRALVQAAARHLAHAGMTSLHICTPEANIPGRRFYEKIGGRVVSTRDDDEDGELTVLVVYAWPDIHALTGLGTLGDVQTI